MAAGKKSKRIKDREIKIKIFDQMVQEPKDSMLNCIDDIAFPRACHALTWCYASERLDFWFLGGGGVASASKAHQSQYMRKN